MKKEDSPLGVLKLTIEKSVSGDSQDLLVKDLDKN